MTSERIQRQIDRLRDEAEDASVHRDWETVRDRAQHALTFDPENPDALGFLAAAERALGDASAPSPEATVTTEVPKPPSEPLPTFLQRRTLRCQEGFGRGRYEEGLSR